MGMCEGRVCIVTGAGRGIGREYALMLAAEGASVVVNDVGGARDGTGSDSAPAHEVVEEIIDRGGDAIASTDDVTDFDAARRLVYGAVEHFGDLHVLVNNAGILRDRMLVNMTEAEWDAVISVHLKGTFAPSHHAAGYWRECSRDGREVDARIINTTSPSGIYGNVGQTNYGAAKAGIAAFSYIASMELRYGVTVNAVAPTALTRMTEDLGMGEADEATKAALAPRWIAPVVVWLASPQSGSVTGRVIEASGRTLAIAEGWHRGPSAAPTESPMEAGEIIAGLLGREGSCRHAGCGAIRHDRAARCAMTGPASPGCPSPPTRRSTTSATPRLRSRPCPCGGATPSRDSRTSPPRCWLRWTRWPTCSPPPAARVPTWARSRLR
ncbi:MAG: SDR family oxidoreductase [Microthrixaceae bacterium]